MSDHSKHKIFDATDCISEQVMFDYIDNKLSPKERHAVEKHLLDCELCSDALEGLETLKDRSRINTIRQKVNEYITENTNSKKVIPINYKAITAIAAALLLLVGAVFLFKEFSSSPMEEKSIAELKEPSPAPSPKIENKTSIADSVNFETPISKNKEVQTGIKKNTEPLTLKQEQKINADNNSLASGGATINAVSPEQTMTLDAVPMDEDKKSDAAADKVAPVASAAPQKSVAYNEEGSHSEAKRKAKDDFISSNSISGKKAFINSDSTYTVVDEMPEYPGGEKELLKYVQKNIQYAPTDDKGNVYQILLIQFTIDPKGKATHPQLLKPQSKEMEKQVVEMVNKMPLWKPGKKNGQVVSVQYSLPIKNEIK